MLLLEVNGLVFGGNWNSANGLEGDELKNTSQILKQVFCPQKHEVYSSAPNS